MGEVITVNSLDFEKKAEAFRRITEKAGFSQEIISAAIESSPEIIANLSLAEMERDESGIVEFLREEFSDIV